MPDVYNKKKHYKKTLKYDIHSHFERKKILDNFTAQLFSKQSDCLHLKPILACFTVLYVSLRPQHFRKPLHYSRTNEFERKNIIFSTQYPQYDAQSL